LRKYFTNYRNRDQRNSVYQQTRGKERISDIQPFTKKKEVLATIKQAKRKTVADPHRVRAAYSGLGKGFSKIMDTMNA
jgi:hypothetical protein